MFSVKARGTVHAVPGLYTSPKPSAEQYTAGKGDLGYTQALQKSGKWYR